MIYINFSSKVFKWNVILNKSALMLCGATLMEIAYSFRFSYENATSFNKKD